ncbi:MAG: hypothetical protein NZ933_01680, partial [Bacteroidia bacterium]|nr:hypothetical protein [Bacteroidia bacterium]
MKLEGISITRRIATGTLWNLIATLTNLIWALLTTPIFYSHLGETTYGILLLIGVVLLYAEILDLGISSTCIR